MDKTPFILMLYEQGGERKTYNCDFPEEFIKAFESIQESEIKIGFFFVVGQDLTGVKSLAEAIKVCKG